MSTTVRSLFAVAFLFAGMTGCAAEADDASEQATDQRAENDEAQSDDSAKVEDAKLAPQKKAAIDLRKAESPKK